MVGAGEGEDRGKAAEEEEAVVGGIDKGEAAREPHAMTTLNEPWRLSSRRQEDTSLHAQEFPGRGWVGLFRLAISDNPLLGDEGMSALAQALVENESLGQPTGRQAPSLTW